MRSSRSIPGTHVLVLTVGAATRAVPIQRTYLLALQGQMLTLPTGAPADNSGPVNFTSLALRVSADGSELTGIANYAAVGPSSANDPQGRGITAITLRKRSNQGGIASASIGQRTAFIKFEDPGLVVNDQARTESLTCLSDWLTRSGFQVRSKGFAKDFDYVVKLRVGATNFNLRAEDTYYNASRRKGTVRTGDMRLIATCGFYQGSATKPLFPPAEVHFDTQSSSLPSPISIADIEGSASQVVHDRELLAILSIESVGQRGGHRLVVPQ